MKRLNLRKADMLFAAVGGWGAAGTKAFCYPTFWMNRFDLSAEELGINPNGTSDTLAGLLMLVLGDDAGS